MELLFTIQQWQQLKVFIIYGVMEIILKIKAIKLKLINILRTIHQKIDANSLFSYNHLLDVKPSKLDNITFFAE